MGKGLTHHRLPAAERSVRGFAGRTPREREPGCQYGCEKGSDPGPHTILGCFDGGARGFDVVSQLSQGRGVAPRHRTGPLKFFRHACGEYARGGEITTRCGCSYQVSRDDSDAVVKLLRCKVWPLSD